MTIKKELLEILVCPKCNGDLKYFEEKKGILCENCKLIYPLTDNIPIMLIDEAEEFLD